MSSLDASLATRRLLVLAGLVAILAGADSASFVQRRSTGLYVDDQPWHFLGANAYWLIEFANDHKERVDFFFRTCTSTGLKVVRLWAFNHKSPSAKGVYDEGEMSALDYVVHSAGQHNVRLILALGNMWTAYRSPEDFMRMAGDDPEGKNLLDFYQSQPTKEFLKSHIQYVVNRNNTFNNLAYRDDPTIMLWDVFNEPRCPGCTEAWQQQAIHSWVEDLALHLKTQAPHQLVAVGTEGYFMDAVNMGWNPGPGASCEGEDWVGLSSLPALDCTVIHPYDRQIENMPPTWRSPAFEDILQWFQKYLEAHASAAALLGKPLIVEEFNVIFPKYNESQRAQLFQLMYDYLLMQQKAGGPLAGVMFWNAAVGDYVWDDGYNVYLDGELFSPLPLVAANESFPNATQPDGVNITQPAPIVTQPVINRHRALLTAPSTINPSGLASATPSSSAPAASSPSPAQRKAITENKEGLDDFRRGQQNVVCCQRVNYTWTPLWGEALHSTLDVASLQRRTQGKTALDVIRQAAILLK